MKTHQAGETRDIIRSCKGRCAGSDSDAKHACCRTAYEV